MRAGKVDVIIVYKIDRLTRSLADFAKLQQLPRADPACRKRLQMIGRIRATTRSGKPCRSPAVSCKRRCRMHGGALGSGAPKGNQNAVKTGFYRKEAIEERRRLKAFLRKSRELLRDL